MIFENKVNVTFGDMLSEIKLPRMYRVAQRFDNAHIAHVGAHVTAQMREFLRGRSLRGKRVAVTIGSRGISFYAEIVRAVVEAFRECGALPVLVTSMGSHAGATSEGQEAMARHLGICPEELGVDLLSSMETRQLGFLRCGTPVYCSADALDADAIFLLNKIKPHADFKGDYESGLIKMSVIGLGKHKGCSSIHKLGFARFAEVLPEAAAVVMQNAPIIGGLAIVENAYDRPAVIEALDRTRIFERERELQILAKRNIARIPSERFDTLVIDEIGKNISGEGLDPNVTGRPGSGLNDGFDFVTIGSIIVRSVTECSSGNGVGIGMADISTIRCAKQLDLALMYTNSITAGILGPSRLPVFLNSDLEALKASIRVSAGDHLDAPRICWIRNTVQLDEMIVSEAMLEELAGNPNITVSGEYSPEFDNEDYLISPFYGKDE